MWQTLGLALLPLFLQAPSAVRVACLGDSITHGARLTSPERHAWPAQLDARLGDGHEVRGFGVGGSTLLREGDRPWLATPEARAAMDWRPDVVVVLLGTNDTCQDARRTNWQHRDGLADDAVALVEAFRAARPGVRVLFCSPTPMFPDAPGLQEDRRANLAARAPRIPEIGRALARVARDHESVEYLDLTRVFGAQHGVDGVHPDPFGHERLAIRLERHLLSRPTGAVDVPAALSRHGVDSDRSEYHGFVSHEFKHPLDDAACRIVEPHVVADGRPWIWRARFFDHQPALDLELLDRGWHLVFCDVADLYGAPRAVERWRRFHDLCSELGLGPRPVLEGMSRGGLTVMQYATAYPDRVAAVYGDNPVCDLRSWPGGRDGKRSEPDWHRALAAYGLEEEEGWAFDPLSPARLEPLARAGVPLFLVVGEEDQVVPPGGNADVLVDRYRGVGGEVEQWRKPGADHHPHGLHPPDPLLRAIERSTGRGWNPATRPAPSAEYRAGAGWGGMTWGEQLEALRELGRAHPDLELVFFGDSITQGLTGVADRLTHADGARVVDRYCGAWRVAGLGLAGDRTEHLLYRIRHGALAGCDPRVVVLQVGINNLLSGGHTARETAEGVAAVVAGLAEHEPGARVVICGPFPTGRAATDRNRLAVDEVHRRIAALHDGERVHYLDLRSLFLDESGVPNDRMRGDAIHITAAGQEEWLGALVPLLEEMLGR